MLENKTRCGPSNLQAIAQAVELLDIPVIANGGVETFEDMQRLAKQTGAAAVMSSEALLERPDVFQPDSLQTVDSTRMLLEHQFQIARDYLSWAQAFPPLPGVLGQDCGSMNIVRGHLFKFLHRYWQEQPDLRTALAAHNGNMSTWQDAHDLVEI